MCKLMITALEYWSNLTGLFFNLKKTEVLALHVNLADERLHIAAGALQLCADFRYLGSWVVDSTHDFRVRLGKAWAAARSMRNYWTREDFTAPRRGR